jgi:hypothetical protein
MITTVKELGDYLCENDYLIDKKLILKIKELLKKEKEQYLDLIRFMRLNDKMGKSVEDLYNEFFNKNK